MLSSQQVRPHFVAGTLITMPVTSALSRTPRQGFPDTRFRARTRDQPEPELIAEERRLSASLRQIHTNFGHPSNHALEVARLQFALHWYVMCARFSIILDLTCLHDSAQTESGGSAAIDLFVLADYAEHFWSCRDGSQHSPESRLGPLFQALHHSLWRATKVEFATMEENSRASSDKSSKTWVVNSGRQPPSFQSKTRSANGMEESGKHMKDIWSTSSATSLSVNSCTA